MNLFHLSEINLRDTYVNAQIIRHIYLTEIMEMSLINYIHLHQRFYVSAIQSSETDN